MDEGEEAEGPQPPGRPEVRASPLLPRSGPSLPFPARPSPHPPRASRGLRGAVIGTYTTALEIIQDTIFPSAGTPHLPGGGGRRALADQAANGRPRARRLLALPGAALAPLGAGPGVCARRPLLRGGRSPARPLPSPPARGSAAEPAGPAPALR